MSEESHAGVGIRGVAVVIDWVVWAFIGYGIALMTGETTGSGFYLQGFSALVWFLSYFIYYILFESFFGQTIGKFAVGIRVATVDGGTIGLRTAVTRNVLRIVDGLFFYIVGAIIIYRSDTNQRFGDRVANTLVLS